jgi:hypothetical protein
MPGRRRDTIEPTRRPRHASPPASRRRFTRTRVVWTIAGIVTLLAAVAAVTVSGVFTDRHVPPRASPPAPTPPGSNAPTKLATEFAQLANNLHAVMGIAISAVGTGQTPLMLGDWSSGTAWSTIKVPLVIAALREEDPPRVTDAMKATITESDNAAAESIWESLGDPVTAAHKVERVLREAGDTTTVVESQRKRPEFTAFGQTVWSLTNQVRFTSVAVCDSRNAPVFDLMSHVENQQSWGIGVIPGTEFKGGWGPSTTGNYLVRQIGVLPTPTGMVAVAIAAEPASGSFDDGTRDLTGVANWLTDHIAELPAGQCGH